MNLLLDTHLLIWALNEDPRLSQKARSYLLDSQNTIYFSVVSVWEIAIKHAAHPDNVEFTGTVFSEFCTEAGFLPLDLRSKHIAALEMITRSADAPPHNDPFDRILLAQAKAENLSFLTHDALIPYYAEPCIIPV